MALDTKTLNKKNTEVQNRSKIASSISLSSSNADFARPDVPSKTCTAAMSLADPIFPELSLTPEQIFHKAGLSAQP